MYYINIKQGGKVETMDQFEEKMLRFQELEDGRVQLLTGVFQEIFESIALLELHVVLANDLAWSHQFKWNKISENQYETEVYCDR